MLTPAGAIGQVESLVNQAAGHGGMQRITQAIKTASAATGVDFSYMLNKASQESSFDPNAKATTSSATGLFQFTSQTWLQMIKSHGAQYGLGGYADQISIDSSGVAHVADPAMRHVILALRKDPTISAEMSGELDKDNLGTLKGAVGGKIGPTELYLAHFLGASGAADFIKTMRSDPNAKAADVVPAAAASNQSVFYDKSGAARSLAQVYKKFAQKFDHAPDLPKMNTMFAMNMPATTSDTLGNDASSFASQQSTYLPPVMSHMKANTSSSLYAAMVIAQANLKNTATTSMSGAEHTFDGHKKNGPSSIWLNGIG